MIDKADILQRLNVDDAQMSFLRKNVIKVHDDSVFLSWLQIYNVADNVMKWIMVDSLSRFGFDRPFANYVFLSALMSDDCRLSILGLASLLQVQELEELDYA